MIKIFTSDQKFVTKDESYIIKSTFNFKTHFLAHKESIGTLKIFNQYEGNNEGLIDLTITENSYSILLPIQEGLSVQNENQQVLLEVGEVILLKTGLSKHIRIKPILEGANYFSFYHIVFQDAENIFNEQMVKSILPIIQEGEKNKLCAVFNDIELPFDVLIGAFEGKNEVDVKLNEQHEHQFVSAITGTFEVEERMIFTEDSLSFKNMGQINIECLSGNGILIALTF